MSREATAGCRPLASRVGLVFALLASAGVAAVCAAPGERGPAARPQSTVGLLDAYLEAWNAHDADKVASFLDEHVTYDDGNTPAPQKGRDSARRNVVEALFRAVPDCAWRRVGPPIVAPGGVAFQWVRSGTNTGAWNDGGKATGRAFELRGATVLRLHDYKILYQGDYYDPAAMRRPGVGR